jgi:hypothetical protein
MNPAYRPMLATLVDEPFDDKSWIGVGTAPKIRPQVLIALGKPAEI